MAGITNSFKIARCIGATVSFSDDVVDSLCRRDQSITPAVLAQMFVACQNLSPEHVPLAAVAALVAILSALVLLPAFVSVLLTVT